MAGKPALYGFKLPFSVFVRSPLLFFMAFAERQNKTDIQQPPNTKEGSKYVLSVMMHVAVLPGPPVTSYACHVTLTEWGLGDKSAGSNRLLENRSPRPFLAPPVFTVTATVTSLFFVFFFFFCWLCRNDIPRTLGLRSIFWAPFNTTAPSRTHTHSPCFLCWLWGSRCREHGS